MLNSAEWFAKQAPTKNCCTVDPKAVKRIFRVLDVTGAKLGLSSTWRLQPDLVQYLRDTGLPIFDVTPQSENGHRGTEISRWLQAHPLVGGFAIVDDDPDADEGAGLAHRFVRTHWKHGLYGKHEKALIALLGEKA